MNKVLIKHIRDSKRRPVGTIVAFDKDKIGYSIRNPKDICKKWDGIEVAAYNAITGYEPEVPRRKVDYSGPYPKVAPKKEICGKTAYNVPLLPSTKFSLDDIVNIELLEMHQKAKRYYKNGGN